MFMGFMEILIIAVALAVLGIVLMAAISAGRKRGMSNSAPNPRLANCPVCGQGIPTLADQCPKCGCAIG
jgi:hypothetical protein